MAQTLEERIKQHEGLRLKPYKDTRGILTIGYGRNLEHVGISQEEAEILFKNDLANSESHLLHVFPWMKTQLDEARYGVVREMVFQLGLRKFCEFRMFIYYLRKENFKVAAEEMLKSRWAQQTPARVKTLARIMETGREE